MKSRFWRFCAVVPLLAILAMPQSGRAQDIDLFPNVVPNGINAGPGEQYHQRFDITLTGSPTASTRALTITVPPELTVVTNSVTATSHNASVRFFFAGTPSTSPYKLAFGLTGTGLSGEKVTVEFDLTTPTNFTGIANGAKLDTLYKMDFSDDANLTDANITVSKHQNRPVRTISFSGPDSTNGDTTVAGGRFYKLTFPSALPDPSHTNTSGLSVGSGNHTDGTSDVLYTFYLSTDSSLVERPLDLSPVSFFTQRSEGDGPLLGTRQNPRFIPGTFIRESFTSDFSTVTADTTNGVISLSGTADGTGNSTLYYVYVLADPAPSRTPSGYTGAGSAKKGFDAFTYGAFSGGVFLGRSGPLKVFHPPEFVVVGWDYDDDNGDDFDDTGVVQVPSDIINMTAVDENEKDNRDITIDTGSFVEKGAAFSTVNSGDPPAAASRVDLLFLAQDVDNATDFEMNIFLSTLSGRGVSDLVGTNIDSLTNSIKVIGTDTLSISSQKFSFNPIVRNVSTNLIVADSTVDAGDYYVYFVAWDKNTNHRVVTEVFNDPFVGTPTSARLLVRHSTTLSIDTFSLNDFDGSNDGDLDVTTGISVSPMLTDADGQFASFLGPAQRIITVSWGEAGLDGDQDVDNNATIELYYSTRSDFRDSRGSVAYTSGNSDGTDLTNAISQGNNDTHKIGEVNEDLDGQFDNQFTWDLWTYVSQESTVPSTGVRYYLYALLKDGVDRLVSLTQDDPTPGGSPTSMAINFLHPPYIRPIEPAALVSLTTIDDPVLVSWEASDVDNAEGAGLAVDPSGGGRSAPNNRSSSPNIRILLSSVDFGEVTTWGSITNFSGPPPGNTNRLWVGNSGDGSLAEEIELNEGVDSAFVIVGNRMRNNLFGAYSNALSDGSLELQTGVPYYVYLAIDDGRDGTVADAVTGAGAQQTNFGNRSPVVRAPGQISFSGTVPVNPPSNTRFIIPNEIKTAVGEVVQYPIVPDVDYAGGGYTSIERVYIYITADSEKFRAIDTDASMGGIQPFVLGANSEIDPSKVIANNAMIDGSSLRLDFYYSDPGGGLTFLDGEQILATANLRANPLTSGTMVSSTITLENSGTRISKMVDDNGADHTDGGTTSMEVFDRATVEAIVDLEGRTTTASDTMTFFLRRVGSYTPVTDSLFDAVSSGSGDIDATELGVQRTPTDAGADKYTLINVPSGRYILTAAIRRHLTGHDTITVEPGVDLTGGLAVSPTRDGSGIDQLLLLAGDAAGFRDSSGTNFPDNKIDSEDFNAINDALFSSPDSSNWNAFADINRDLFVNGTDLDFATANETDNTGAGGKIQPVFPTFKRALPEGSNAEAIVTLADLPEGEIKAGETFDVTVEVSGARAVRTYEVHLTYDQTKLVVDNIMSGGSLLQDYLTSMAGKLLTGEIGLVNSIIGQTPLGASGEGTLATIRFRAISRASETRLFLSDALLIDVDHISAKPKVSGEVTVVLSKDPIVYHDADGVEIKGLILAETDTKVDFNDFVVLAKAFGTSAGSPGFDLRADLNADDMINFADFTLFAADFGRVAVDAPSSGWVTKPTAPNGANPEAEISLKVEGEAKMGQDIKIVADLSQANAVQGWGLSLKFDPTLYEFVEATAPEAGLLGTSGATTPLFLVHQDGPDQISLGSAIASGEAATGEGSLAILTFRPKTEFEEATFEVFSGVLFDPDQGSNPLVMREGLSVQLAPAQFALNQNYPNPFNPETTLSYDLAEGSGVRLDIYNIMGQLVTTLVSEEQPAGRYRVVWSGQDVRGRQVASGIYFYRLHTETFKAVRKLMLLK